MRNNPSNKVDSPVELLESGLGTPGEDLVRVLGGLLICPHSPSVMSSSATGAIYTVCGHQHGSYSDGSWALWRMRLAGGTLVGAGGLLCYSAPLRPHQLLFPQPTLFLSLQSPGTCASLGVRSFSLTHQVFLFPLILSPLKSQALGLKGFSMSFTENDPPWGQWISPKSSCCQNRRKIG